MSDDIKMQNNIENPLPGVPDVESPFFDKLFDAKSGPDAWKHIAHSLHTDGFAVLDFPDDSLDVLSETIKRALYDRFAWKQWNARRKIGKGGMRVQDGWRDVDAIKRIAINQTILDILEYCYGRPAIPFQTLNFAVGSQQHFHTDEVHFSSIPERFMAGVWVALDDVDGDNGPLIYYPGSHKLPCYGNHHIGHDFTGNRGGQQQFHDMWCALVEAKGLKRQEFHAKKGQALIWAANLLHGGQQHSNRERTRWSQVTHYYFEDCFYYCPMSSDMAMGRAMLRSPMDIRTGQAVQSRYLDKTVSPDFSQMLHDNTLRGLEGHDPQFPPYRALSAGEGSSAPEKSLADMAAKTPGLASKLRGWWRHLLGK